MQVSPSFKPQFPNLIELLKDKIKYRMWTIYNYHFQKFIKHHHDKQNNDLQRDVHFLIPRTYKFVISWNKKINGDIQQTLKYEGILDSLVGRHSVITRIFNSSGGRQRVWVEEDVTMKK